MMIISRSICPLHRIELVKAVVIAACWPLLKEELRHSDLMGDKELLAIESSDQSVFEARHLSAESHAAPLLEVRRITIEIVKTCVH